MVFLEVVSSYAPGTATAEFECAERLAVDQRVCLGHGDVELLDDLSAGQACGQGMRLGTLLDGHAQRIAAVRK